MLTFEETRILVEEVRRENIFSCFHKIDSEELRGAWQRRDLQEFIERLSLGFDGNYSTASHNSSGYSLFIEALLEKTLEYVYALLLFNVNLKKIMNEAIHVANCEWKYYPDDYLIERRAISYLSAFGCDLEDERDFLDLFQEITDFTGFNFIGLSYKGVPVSEDMLLQYKIPYNGGGIFRKEDLLSIEMEERTILEK